MILYKIEIPVYTKQNKRVVNMDILINFAVVKLSKIIYHANPGNKTKPNNNQDPTTLRIKIRQKQPCQLPLPQRQNPKHASI